MDTSKRTFFLSSSGQVPTIVDQRSYLQIYPDPYLKNRNNSENLYWNIPAELDSINPLNPQGSSSSFPTSFPYFPALILILFSFLLFRRLKIKLIPSLFILFFSLIFVIPMIRSGILIDYGLPLWGPNGHDGIWHLSLIEQLKKTPFSPSNPIFAPESLKNYHYGFNFLSAIFLKIIPLNSIQFYFQFFPLLSALSLGTLSYHFAKKNSNHKTALFFVFLNFFAGSFGWVITWLRDRTFGGESLFWSMQSISTLINPPFALSLILTLLGLILWQKLRPQGKTMSAIFLGIFFSSLAAVKIYAAILLGLAFFFFWALKLLKKKAQKFDLYLWISMAASSLLILTYFSVFSGKTALVFKPFWFVHSLVESLDKLYLPRLAVLRQNLALQIFSWKLPFLVALEGLLLAIFFVGNLGTRIIALPSFLFKKKKNDLDKIFLLIALFAFFFPLFFIQSGTTWNTIQFFYYLLFVFNFYFAQTLARLSSHKKYLPLLFFILLLTIPSSLSTLKGYLGNPAPAAISHQELAALSFLKNQEEGIVLTYPWDNARKQNQQTPIPLRFYETSAYVSALSSHPVFLEDEMNLEITGYPWEQRKKEMIKFFQSQDPIWARGFLLNNSLEYVYLVEDQKLSLPETDLGVKMIFNSGQVRIYQVLN